MHDPQSVHISLTELGEFAVMVSQELSAEVLDWHWRPSDEEWSLTEVVCHLRDVEKEVHQVRFRRLMESDNVFLAGENPDAWVEERQYRRQDGPAALQDFLQARRETVSLLQGIEDESIWDRHGRHALFGLTTMHELLDLAVRHDRAHRRQIDALLHMHP